MRDDVPSRTAALVAAMRGAAALLPERLRLIDDPFGLRFGGPFARVEKHAGLARRARPLWFRGIVRDNIHLMQLRTRVLDDAVLRFYEGGGRQIVLLGAGFDCRAWRLPIDDATVFEVDHPATQRRKQELLATAPRAHARFLAYDFEREPMPMLPARLAAIGHDARAPTLAILEGVLPYLTDAAVDATFAAARDLLAPGSPFAFTYFDRALVTKTRESRIVRWLGEPHRFGLDPATLGAWTAERGFALEDNVALSELAARLLPREDAASLEGSGRHVAVARRRESDKVPAS